MLNKGSTETNIPMLQITKIIMLIWLLESLPDLSNDIQIFHFRSKTMQVIVQISVTPDKVPKHPNAKHPNEKKFFQNQQD